MRREAPGLTAEDLALWRHATQDDAPLRERPPEESAAPAPAVPLAEPRPPRAERVPAPAAGADGRTMQRLRRGQIEIGRRLDLHGMTQAQAYRAVTRALAVERAAGTRCVLVITGKGGSGCGAGVLRSMLPRWLAEPPNAELVLAAVPARRRDGGEGAFYVLLRKSRRRPGGV